MTIAHRCPGQMHVEAAGCRDRHQRVAAGDAHRDRLDNLAGIDAERPRLIDRGIGLLVRDGLERDAVGFEMLRYLRHHPTPFAGEPSITRIRPRDPGQLPARRGRPAGAWAPARLGRSARRRFGGPACDRSPNTCSWRCAVGLCRRRTEPPILRPPGWRLRSGSVHSVWRAVQSPSVGVRLAPVRGAYRPVSSRGPLRPRRASRGRTRSGPGWPQSRRLRPGRAGE